MADLLDILPATEIVVAGGKDVTVYEIPVKVIGVLFERFPELMMLFDGKMPDRKRWPRLFPDMVAALIAAGVGKAGEKKYEDHAAKLGMDTQLKFIEAVVKTTIPNGFAALASRMESLSAVIAPSDAPLAKSLQAQSND